MHFNQLDYTMWVITYLGVTDSRYPIPKINKELPRDYMQCCMHRERCMYPVESGENHEQIMFKNSQQKCTKLGR